MINLFSLYASILGKKTRRASDSCYPHFVVIGSNRMTTTILKQISSQRNIKGNFIHVNQRIENLRIDTCLMSLKVWYSKELPEGDD